MTSSVEDDLESLSFIMICIWSPPCVVPGTIIGVRAAVCVDDVLGVKALPIG